MKFYHWAAAPVTLAPRSYLQESGYKPHGFWFDVDEDWKRWCESESDFDREGRIVQHEVAILKPECLLHLNSPAKLDAFTKQYGVLPPWRTRPEADDYLPRYLAIDWSAVAAQYGGILIAPYQWKRRLELTWYYGWDCASGCAWDLSLIELEPILEVA